MPLLEDDLQTRDSVLLDLLRVLGSVRDTGILQDIVYLCQRVGAMKRGTFSFDVPHVRPCEYASREISESFSRLEERGLAGLVRDQNRSYNPTINSAEQGVTITHVEPDMVRAVANLPSNNHIRSLARVVKIAERFGVDFDKEELTERDYEVLSDFLLYPRNWIVEYHKLYIGLTDKCRLMKPNHPALSARHHHNRPCQYRNK